MHNRVLGVGVLVLIVAALVVWWSGAFAGQPQLPGPAADAPGVAAPAAAPAAGSPGAAVDVAAVPAAANLATDGRVAGEANVFDDKRPAIVGRVVGADGQPVAGATVYAAPGMGFANANGQFDADTFDVADFADLEDFDMSRMMNVVREQLADRVETATDADGRFRIQAKGATRGVGLRVAARGYALLDRRVDRPTAQDLDVGTLTLQRGVVVLGRVVTPDGAPVVGARVSRVHEAEARMMGGVDLDMPEMGEVEALRGGEAATTDDKGRFALLHLAAGDFALRARHPDHPTSKSDPLSAAAGSELRDVLVTMPRGGQIRGTVVGLPADRAGLAVLAAKKPRTDADPTGMMAMFGGDMADMLADLGVSVGERQADIAADGSFVLRGLAADTYRVWVGRRTPGFAGNGTLSNRVEAMPGGSVELRFEPGIEVTLTVVDARSEAPVERLWVRDRLRGGSGGGMADVMANMPQPRKLGQYPGGRVTVALRPKAKQTLTLALAATGYAPWERSDIVLPTSGALDLGTVRLEPAPVLQVTVLDADSGRPLAGATVRLAAEGRGGNDNPFARLMPFADQNGGPDRGKTDRDGRCTLNRFVDRSGQVEVEAKDHAPFVGGPLQFTATGPDTFVARIVTGGSAAIAVVDEKDAAVEGAVVEHKSVHGDTATRKTDAQGMARFEHLAPGAHSFRLGKVAGPMAMFGAFGRDGDRGEPWQPLEVQDRAQATLRLVRQPTATLRGVVRENGAPLAGARVQFRAGTVSGDQAAAEEMVGDLLGAVGGTDTRQAKSGDDGGYTLQGLPEGEHRLQVTHRGRAMTTRLTVVLRNGDNTFDIDLDMTTVRGVVLDPQGNPVDGARLRVKKVVAAEPGAEIGEAVGEQMEAMMPGMNLGGGSTIKTDAAGAFELRGVDADVELQVSATAKGFAPASAKVASVRGQVVTMPALRLGAAGKLRVAANAAQPFAAVRATWAGEGTGVAPVMQVLRKGKATLDGLRPGPWDVEVLAGPDENAARTRQRVEVIAGQTVDVQL